MIQSGRVERDAPERVSDEQALEYAFRGVEADQYDLNRRAASRAERLTDALAWARSRPWVYALAGDTDPERTAERCAVLEASTRLHMSEVTVRSLAGLAERARLALPLLWHQARDGFASLTQVEDAVGLLAHFADRQPELAEFDRTLSDLALHTSPASFRAKAKLLARRLAPLPDGEVHAIAFAKRRVVREPMNDGMSWLGAVLATVDAVAIERDLTAQAKRMTHAERAGRSRDQIRADLLTDALRRKGSDASVKTKVFVTVPLDRLSPEARATVRRRSNVHAAVGEDLNVEPMLIGDGPIDDETARHLVLEAGAFTRVITDPVTGVVLDMDRRSRTVTRAQREWLLLHHGTCPRDGCRRPAPEADIDHWVGYNSAERGPTDIHNLGPLCDPDHAVKDTTRIRFRRRPDRTVELSFPTGFTTRRLIESLPPLGKLPPF